MSQPPHDDPPPESEPSGQAPGGQPAGQGQAAGREWAAGQGQAAGRESAAGAAFTSTDAARLLVRALAGLPAEDRDKVYVWLLGTSLTGRRDLTGPLARRIAWARQAEAPAVQQQEFREAGFELVRGLVRTPSGTAQQMVPVRFSAEQHARLRTWCAEHGFSMATVIRGLVDRFLDTQQPDRP